VIGLLAVAFLTVLVVGSVLLGQSFDGVGLGLSRAAELLERVVRNGQGEDRVALIDLTGPILGSGAGENDEDVAGWIVRQLRQAREDERVKGVLLWVDSPGGGLTASDLIYNEVNQLRAAGKPVVAYVSGLAASGGYYVIAPADAIIISPTGLTGSFGVILNRFNFKGLMKKVGVQAEPLMSTEMKDIGSPFRDLTESERSYFVGITKHFHQRFVEIIANGRTLERERVESLANGKLYTAEEAKAFGLVDEIAYFDVALDKIRDLSGAREAAAIRYGSPNPIKQLLGIRSVRGLAREAAIEAVQGLQYEAAAPAIELRYRDSEPSE
jgi:protease-4